MLQPLAIAVIGGLLSSMVLSLVFTPAIHYYLGRTDSRDLRASEARLEV
jgi:Cu/Ag efflux pump CusA